MKSFKIPSLKSIPFDREKPVLSLMHVAALLLWFSCKIAIYLLVLYAILFSVVVTYGAYRGYDYYQRRIEDVKLLATGSHQGSRYIEQFKQWQQAKEPNERCTEIQQDWIAFDSVSSSLKKTILFVEDAGFYTHPGVDLESIVNAIEVNKHRGKKSFGASTLTQQLAKNLFLENEKSWERKIKELGYTFLLERYLTKDRIFELYLNTAQFGPCQFGCEAAAQHFYKKSCRDLNLQQSIDLASILANPNKYDPSNYNSKLLAARRALIYENLYLTGYLKRDTLSADSTSGASASSELVAE